jgi:hypothetical protein
MDSKLLRLACLSSIVYTEEKRLIDILSFDEQFTHIKCFNSHCSQGFVCYDRVLSSCVVVFRGTDDIMDVIRDVRIFPTKNKYRLGNGYVHKGFYSALDWLYNDMLDYINVLKNTFEDMNIICTGHSLGAAMATIMAYNISAKELYTFGSPRVGTRAFVKELEKINLKHIRVVNGGDIVTKSPSPVIYSHHGEKVTLNPVAKGGVKNRCISAHFIYNYISNLYDRCSDIDTCLDTFVKMYTDGRCETTGATAKSGADLQPRPT